MKMSEQEICLQCTSVRTHGSLVETSLEQKNVTCLPANYCLWSGEISPF